MKSKFIKPVITLSMCLGVMIPSILVCGYSKSYVGEFTFSHDIYVGGSDSLLHGNSFYCADGNFKLTTRISKQTNAAQATSEYFYVYVYRKDLLGDTYVACGVLNRSGASSASWKNMKHDNYSFKLTKSKDGCSLKGSVELEY